MSIERERYEQMTNVPGTIWGRIKVIFVFPPLPRQEPPAKAPSGGPIETPPALWPIDQEAIKGKCIVDKN